MKGFRTLTLSFLLLATAVLAGCMSKPSTAVPYINHAAKGTLTGAAAGALAGTLGGVGLPGAAVGGVMGFAIGRHIDRRLTDQERLEALVKERAAQVIKQGEDVKLVLPSDHYFYKYTPHIQERARGELGLIARYLRSLHSVSITVSGFTDNQGSEERNLALSREQAEAIVSYLWTQNLAENTSLLFAVGYGSAHDIASNHHVEGQAKNRRIEITFRQVMS